MITDKLSSKKLPSLKLPAAFPTLIPEGKASTMSWNDQVSAEKGRDLVFGPETASQALILGSLNIIHGSAESAPQLGRECDCVTYNVTHDTDLWDGDYYVTSLSGYDIHLETDAKVLAISLICLAHFIQKHPLKGHPIEQFPSVFFFLFINLLHGTWLQSVADYLQ